MSAACSTHLLPSRAVDAAIRDGAITVDMLRLRLGLDRCAPCERHLSRTLHATLAAAC